jgi:hypothetical protein
VPPGINTVVVYVAKRLGSHSEWVPAAPLDRACERSLTVSKAPSTIDVWGAVVVYVPDQVTLVAAPFEVCLAN